MPHFLKLSMLAAFYAVLALNLVVIVAGVVFVMRHSPRGQRSERGTRDRRQSVS